MRWPGRKGSESTARSEAPAPIAPPPRAWAALPPPARAIAAPALTADPDRFIQRLAAWEPTGVTREGVGHLRTEAAPVGQVHGLVRVLDDQPAPSGSPSAEVPTAVPASDPLPVARRDLTVAPDPAPLPRALPVIDHPSRSPEPSHRDQPADIPATGAPAGGGAAPVVQPISTATPAPAPAPDAGPADLTLNRAPAPPAGSSAPTWPGPGDSTSPAEGSGSGPAGDAGGPSGSGGPGPGATTPGIGAAGVTASRASVTSEPSTSAPPVASPRASDRPATPAAAIPIVQALTDPAAAMPAPLARRAGLGAPLPSRTGPPLGPSPASPLAPPAASPDVGPGSGAPGAAGAPPAPGEAAGGPTPPSATSPAGPATTGPSTGGLGDPSGATAVQRHRQDGDHDDPPDAPEPDDLPLTPLPVSRLVARTPPSSAGSTGAIGSSDAGPSGAGPSDRGASGIGSTGLTVARLASGGPGPLGGGPSPTGPVPTGPVSTGPVPTGPVSTGPAPTRPAPTGPEPIGLVTQARSSGPPFMGSTTADLGGGLPLGDNPARTPGPEAPVLPTIGTDDPGPHGRPRLDDVVTVSRAGERPPGEPAGPVVPIGSGHLRRPGLLPVLRQGSAALPATGPLRDAGDGGSTVALQASPSPSPGAASRPGPAGPPTAGAGAPAAMPLGSTMLPAGPSPGGQAGTVAAPRAPLPLSTGGARPTTTVLSRSVEPSPPVAVEATGGDAAETAPAAVLSPVIQREEPPSPAAAPASPAPAAASAPAPAHQPASALSPAELDELSRKLYDRLRSRLSAELRIDRERTGSLVEPSF